jgi:hypothetical protein
MIEFLRNQNLEIGRKVFLMIGSLYDQQVLEVYVLDLKDLVHMLPKEGLVLTLRLSQLLVLECPELVEFLRLLRTKKHQVFMVNNLTPYL